MKRFGGWVLIVFSFLATLPTQVLIPQVRAAGAVLGASTIAVTVAGITNTQAVLAYTAPDSNACTVQVSENSSLVPLVHDVDPTLFAGSNFDSRAEAISGGTKRIFIVGKRTVEKALDGNNYSRALQAYTTHYYQVTCGSAVANGSFTTANIPIGNIANEALQSDPATGAAVMPTLPNDTTTGVIDPKTGAFIKRVSLPGVVSPFIGFNGRKTFCGQQLVGPGPGYLCVFPSLDGGAAQLYYILPSTGETRFLGRVYVPYDAYRQGPQSGWWPAGGATGVGDAFIDPADPLSFYFNGVTNQAGQTLLLKFTYSGNFTAAAGPSLTITNMTPDPTTQSLGVLMHAFDPTFDPTLYGCSLQVGGQYGLIACGRSDQDSYGWLGAIDMGNKQPLGSCGSNCMHVIGAVNMVANPQSRWCGLHTPDLISNTPLAEIVPHGFNIPNGGVGHGWFQTTLATSIGAGDTTITVAGEPYSNTESYVMDAAVGDYFNIDQERLKIAAKNSSTTWTVVRGTSGNGAAAHSAGTSLIAECEDGTWSELWWKFLADPTGMNGGFLKEKYLGGHGDVSPTAMMFEYGDGYAGSAIGQIMNNLNIPIAWNLSTSLSFAGARANAYGNSYTHYPSYQQRNASAWNQNWFLDAPLFEGADQFGGATPVGGQLYKYNAGVWGVLHRKQLSTVVVSGGRGFTDISGPGAVITGNSGDSFKYCVANAAGECVSGSAIGDTYINIPGSLTRTTCGGGNYDVCAADLAVVGQGVYQFGFLPNTVGGGGGNVYGAGYSRKLSGVFNGYRSEDYSIAKTFPDGSWTMFVSGDGINANSQNLLMIKMPPFPTSLDPVNRSTFVRAPISITTPQGQGITSAAIDFGYTEQGTAAQHYCTTRRESCTATASTVNDGNPFSFTQTDAYGKAPCASSCTITLPVLPMHVAYYQVKFYNAAGQLVTTGDAGVAAESAVTSISGGTTGGGGGGGTPTDTTPPIISAIQASAASTTASVSWTTDEVADTQIDYGTTNAYGQSSALNTSPVTSHSVSISALTAATTYHYRVKSKDPSGNAAMSADQTFTTAAAGGGGGTTSTSTGQISGTRIGIIDDFISRGAYAFYGDTHQPSAWLPTGTFTYNGVTTPGSLVTTLNDGGRNWLADSPSCEGNVMLNQIVGINWNNPANTIEQAFNCTNRYSVSSAWPPAALGTCTAGYAAGCDWKSRGPFSVDGKLYLFVYRQEGPALFYAHDSTLIVSSDGGATWSNPAHVGISTDALGDTPAAPGDPSYPADMMWPENYPAHNAIGHVMPIQMCQDGSMNCPTGANVAGCDPAQYVCFWIENYNFTKTYLARVTRTNLPHLKASEWQYYQGGDGTQNSAWGSNLNTMASISVSGALGGIAYLKDLGIYYLTNEGAHSIDHWWAPHPWGPWTEFFNEDFSWATAGTFPTPILATARLVSSNPTHVQITVAATRYDHDGVDNHWGGKNTYLLMDITGAAATSTGSGPSVPTISSFTASPNSITVGGSATLSWSTSGATALSIDNGVGSVTGLTSKTVSPTVNTTYTLTATNSAGSVTATAPVTVNLAPDVTAPTASITAPANGSTVSGAITFSAVASDPNVAGQVQSGLKSLSLLVSGSVIATTTSGSISKSLDTTSLSNAPHALTAVAVDNAGNTFTTAATNITVNNQSGMKYPRTLVLSSLEGLSTIPSNQSIIVGVYAAGSGASLESFNTTPSGGKYTVTFAATDPQLVNIKVKTGTYLAQIITGVDTTVNSAVPLSIPPLIAGDLNNDNAVNSLDYSVINSHWLQSFSGADINADGLVNSLDFAILKNNFSKTGQ